MRFHCMTHHGFAFADVIRLGDLVGVTVHCIGAPLAPPDVCCEIPFTAPRLQRHEGSTPDKHFALLALSHFNRTVHPEASTATKIPFDQLELDDSLVLSEAV